jgi:hypothetical protein
MLRLDVKTELTILSPVESREAFPLTFRHYTSLEILCTPLMAYVPFEALSVG